MESLKSILDVIRDTIENFQVDRHNDFTYAYDKGYLKCLINIEHLLQIMILDHVLLENEKHKGDE